MKITFLYGATFSLGWGRSQNLASSLARLGHEVEYVDCIRPLGKSAPAPVSVPAGIAWHAAAPGIPDRNWSTLLHALWQGSRLSMLPRGRRDILVFYGVPHPFLQGIANRKFAPRRRIYDCADDKVSTFRDLSGERAAKRVAAWERALVGNVDAITAINRANLDRLDPQGRLPGFVVPNGVDLELFRFRKRSIPEGRPLRIAYAGAVNDRLDIPRIARILDANPGIELRIFGGDHSVLDPIRGHPRLSLGGLVPYRELPAALDECDIGLVPYRNLESIRSSSPLKSLQYLALGLPVLAFDYPGIPTFDGQVRILEGDALPLEARNWQVPDTRVVEPHSWDGSARMLLEAAS